MRKKNKAIMEDQESKTIQIPEGYMAIIDGDEIEFVKLSEPRERADYGDTYYFVDDICRVSCQSDYLSSFDTFRYEAGNYFLDEERAEHAAQAIKELLKKYHVNNE